MSETLFDELNLLARTLHAPAGMVLFRRDESCTSVYLVRTGKIALLWPDAEETNPMELLGPGSIIGLPAALNGAYSATAKATSDSELGVVGVARVVDLLESNPAFCRTAMRMMGQEVARMRSLVAEHCTQAHDES
jgi:CRP-like cAMP-binding protein